jgi:TatA/E family protein of Tat protein translocase
MPLFGLGATELLIILVVIILLFMLPKKLPSLIKSIKDAKAEWKKGDSKEKPAEKPKKK